jgi:hypothetical protein
MVFMSYNGDKGCELYEKPKKSFPKNSCTYNQFSEASYVVFLE